MRARRVERLVVHAERHVRVLEERVRREHRVVRLDDRVKDLRRRRDGERELRLAAVVDREALEEKRAEACNLLCIRTDSPVVMKDM